MGLKLSRTSDHYLLSHWTPDWHIHNHSWTVLYGNNFSCWLLYWQIFKCEGISTAIPKLRQDFRFILFFKKHCSERIKITTSILNENTDFFKRCDAFTICFSKNAKPVSLATYWISPDQISTFFIKSESCKTPEFQFYYVTFWTVTQVKWSWWNTHTCRPTWYSTDYSIIEHLSSFLNVLGHNKYQIFYDNLKLVNSTDTVSACMLMNYQPQTLSNTLSLRTVLARPGRNILHCSRLRHITL